MNFFKQIDRTIFSGGLRRLNQDRKTRNRVVELEQGGSHKIQVVYRQDQSVISGLCEKYGSDKGGGVANRPFGWLPHTYADFYSMLFDHCRTHVRFVFECGLGTNNSDLPSSMGILGRPGASLRVWRDYFPAARVIGADIDKDILFNEDRIETYFVDQTSEESILELWANIPEVKFNLMIDDGLHTYAAGVSLFENSISKLDDQGIYVIEDVHLKDLIRFQSYFKDKQYIVYYVNLYRPQSALKNNNMVVVRKKVSSI
jgi:hypothetical protein